MAEVKIAVDPYKRQMFRDIIKHANQIIFFFLVMIIKDTCHQAQSIQNNYKFSYQDSITVFSIESHINKYKFSCSHILKNR